jgi:hypothetical protein
MSLISIDVLSWKIQLRQIDSQPSYVTSEPDAGLDEDILSTGITLYQLREGDTIIGNAEAEEIPHIILKGPR